MLLRVLVLGVSGILLLAVLAMVAFQLWAQRKHGPAIQAFRDDVTSQVDFFCEQQALLGKEPWFHEPRAAGDAGPLLNDWLRVASGPPDLGESPLRLPRHLLLLQKSLGPDDWVTSDLVMSSLDFGWMRQLHAFDYWNAIPQASIPPDHRYYITAAPLLEFSLLVLWSKLRLRYAIEQGTSLEAVRDVRQIAWLAYRTDTQVGGMFAIELLKLEGKLHASMENPPPDWRPMSPEQLKRFTALLESAPAYSSIATPAEVGRKARACEPAIGRCIGLVEAAALNRYLEPIAKDAYRAEYLALKANNGVGTCPTDLLATIWEQGITIDEPLTIHGHGAEDYRPLPARLLPTRAIKMPLTLEVLASMLRGPDKLRALKDVPPTP
ncbi:hypothetical protein [Corallococcus macrosporus]|uniref:hypothetical protein n=1 Tax=Corallococcus macrosporus TaxID=35 RepID=UPI000BB3DA7F|nr:hypothetical protein [Corallococcus macrosporus]